MSKIVKIQRFLVYLLPAALFFSYHPVISLGSTNSMNLELSIPLLWLVLFGLISLPRVPSIIRFFGLKKIAIAAILPLYLWVSCLWSENTLRAILTSGIFSLIAFAALNIISLKSELKKSKLIKAILIPSAAVSLFCWLQCFADILGIARENTLLCLGCTYTSFGFPHPNGFAIEPQFMGNLLIAPVLLCFYLLFSYKPKTFRKKLPLIALTIFLATTLFLTFSRGAIYSFTLGLAALTIWQQFPIKKQKSKKSRALLTGLFIFMGSLILSLSAQGLFAVLSPTSDTFVSGVAKSIHQLSLGKIDLRQAPEVTIDQDNQSTFSGYVAESTDIRLNLTDLAIKTWTKSPSNMILGVGLGSAGTAVYKAFPDKLGSAKEIIQNQYISVLLELGLVGVSIIVSLIIYTIIKTRKALKNQSLLISILFAFSLTILFFSGLPNVLHIYLFPFFFVDFFKN